MKNATILGALVLSTGLLLGTTGCGGDASAQDDATAETPSGPTDVVKTIEAFFEATTSADIAAAFPDHADETTFSQAVQYTDPEAGSKDVAAAMADFALVKVSDPKAKLSISVDEAKVTVDGDTATVPVEAITVKSGEKAVPNSKDLAEEVNHLVFRDGSWLIAFPDAPAASASPAASPSASAGTPAGSGK